MREVWLVVFLLVCFPSCRRTASDPAGRNGKPLSHTVGITHAGISYTHNPGVSCMKDGAEQILNLGSKVIKLWFSDDPQGAYSVNCDWGQFTIENSLDLIRTDYYREVLGMDFAAFVLETHTFDKSYPESNINWYDGMTPEECERVEREMYELTEYLMTEYNGTGKQFILQNWEGDNMLGGRFWRMNAEKGWYYQVDEGPESANPEADSLMRVRIKGLTDWFNYRQKGVDRAMEKYRKTSDVTVLHALEINFVYLDSRDDGWPHIDSPTLLNDVVPYTDCDLYSLSCWGSLTVERAHTLRDRLVLYESAVGNTYTDISDSDKEKPRRPHARPGQLSKLMLGEYGAIERFQQTEEGSWGPDLNDLTDRRHREVLQIQTDLALELGLEYVLYWELYCNVPRVDTDPPLTIDNRAGELAVSNDQLQGNWLIRVDGTCTEGYKYLKGLLDPGSGLYFSHKYTPEQVYRIDGIYSGFEIAGEFISGKMLSNRTDEKTFGDEIIVYGSVDGESYHPVETEAFFTRCVPEGEQYTAQVVYINKNKAEENYRYFKIGELPGSENLSLQTVKLYKPNPVIEKP